MSCSKSSSTPVVAWPRRGNVADFLRLAEGVLAKERGAAIDFEKLDLPPLAYEKGHVDAVAHVDSIGNKRRIC
jgi:hypothetical protein